MLRSLYRQFTGSKIDCPRYGHHWEDIGFQVDFFNRSTNSAEFYVTN